MTEQLQANPQIQQILKDFERLNEEGRENLAEYASVLTLTGKYTPGTIRLSWVRRRAAGTRV